MNTQLKDPPVQDDLTRLEKIQAFFEDLEVQMALGRKEFQDFWSNDMKGFRQFLQTEKSILEDEREAVRETWGKILHAMDVLDETMDKVEEDIDKVWEEAKNPP